MATGTYLSGRDAVRRCSTSYSTPLVMGAVACWSCAASRAWARSRCWTMRSTRRRSSALPGPPASSPRWNSRSPGCISCVRPCSIVSTACLTRSARRCVGLSSSAAAKRRVSWLPWQRSACYPTRPRSSGENDDGPTFVKYWRARDLAGASWHQVVERRAGLGHSAKTVSRFARCRPSRARLRR